MLANNVGGANAAPGAGCAMIGAACAFMRVVLSARVAESDNGAAPVPAPGCDSKSRLVASAYRCGCVESRSWQSWLTATPSAAAPTASSAASATVWRRASGERCNPFHGGATTDGGAGSKHRGSTLAPQGFLPEAPDPSHICVPQRELLARCGSGDAFPRPGVPCGRTLDAVHCVHGNSDCAHAR